MSDYYDSSESDSSPDSSEAETDPDQTKDSFKRDQSDFSVLDHSSDVYERVACLLFRHDCSDVTFVLGEERIAAHKLVLASSSDYFRALLFGGLRESHEKEIVLRDVSLVAFLNLLEYIYTGHLNLKYFNEEILLEILGLSHEYDLEKLHTPLCSYLETKLSIDNACLIYDRARLFGFDNLCRHSLRFIDSHANEILRSEAFLRLSTEALRGILLRDSFFAEEINIFKAVERWWAERSEEEDISKVAEAIRLPLISVSDLQDIVKKSNLIPADRVLEAIDWKTKNGNIDLKYRGSLVYEENLATLERGAKVLTGEFKDNFLAPKTPEHLGVDPAYHSIGDQTGITIDLGGPFIINHIVLRLVDNCSFKGVKRREGSLVAYSYNVDVSMNLNHWRRVIDHSKYHCRSLQRLHFEPLVCRYIRVIGTRSWADNSLHLISFEAMFTEKRFKLQQGILVPESNVASLKMGACVIEGDNGVQDGSVCQMVIDGNWKKYSYVDGFTQHTIGSGAIILQLAQPYMIDTIGMLLWCRDSRRYSYYIETSIDMKEWTRVVDRTSERCRSWQFLTFEAVPVVFIKIVGTASTAGYGDGRWFHVVHFECQTNERE